MFPLYRCLVTNTRIITSLVRDFYLLYVVYIFIYLPYSVNKKQENKKRKTLAGATTGALIQLGHMLVLSAFHTEMTKQAWNVQTSTILPYRIPFESQGIQWHQPLSLLFSKCVLNTFWKQSMLISSLCAYPLRILLWWHAVVISTVRSD